MNLNHSHSLSYAKWTCKYHMIFASKSFYEIKKRKGSTMVDEGLGSFKYKYRVTILVLRISYRYIREKYKAI